MDPATLECLLVREIRKANEISRRDLADRLEVARSTAGRRVDSLIDRGLLREKGIEDRSEAGRPKRLLALQSGHGNFLGIEFDARNLFVALVDFAQNTIVENRFPLPSRPTKEEVLKLIREQIEEYSAGSNIPLLGVGIGVPGMVNQAERIAIGYPYIEKWEEVDLSSELDISPERLHIENNTRTVALGEYWFSEPDSIENLVCITVRTGISAAVISDGRLIRGSHEMAGEIRGWKVREPSKSKDRWLEDVATVRAFQPDGNTSATEWKEFVQACNTGEKSALKQLREFANLHADTAARIVQLVDPEKIVFSSAFNTLGDLYLDMLRGALADSLAEHYFSPPPVSFVERGEFAGAHGAAALAAANYKPA